MRKYFYIFLAAALALASCAKEEIIPEEEQPIQEEVVPQDQETTLQHITFTATTDDGLTKTTLGDGYSIVWSNTDQITVFPGASAIGETYNCTTPNPSVDATFEKENATTSETYYALSPKQESAKISDGKITANLPTTQNATDGRYDPKANISVAKTTDRTLQFKNVGALLGVTIGDESITSIKVETLNGNDKLSGTATIDYNNGNPTVNVTASQNYVETTASGAGTYYFIVYPGEYKDGFRIYLGRGGYTYKIKNTTPLELKRNDNVLLANIDTVPAEKWKVVFTPGEQVFIKGLSNADENGQEVSYIPDSYYAPRTDGIAPTNPAPGDNSALAGITYNYEVWAKIAHDDVVYFETESGARFAISNEAGTGVAPIAPGADGRAFAVSEDVYRIRLNLTSGDADAQILRVKQIKYSIYGGNVSETLTLDNYDKKGTWKKDDFVFTYATDKNWDLTNHRYFFSVYFNWKGGYAGGEINNVCQTYGSCNKYNNNYGSTTGPGEDYYYLQPFTGEEWDMIFYLPKDIVFPGMANQSKKGTLNVCFNNAYGHFTHGFTNVENNN